MQSLSKAKQHFLQKLKKPPKNSYRISKNPREPKQSWKKNKFGSLTFPDNKATCLTLCDPHILQPAKLLCPWNSPGKNTGVDCHSLLQRICPTQGLNPGSLYLSGPGFSPWVGKFLWRREWQSIRIFLPGEFHGQRSLVNYSPWGHKESNTTKRLTHTHTPTMNILITRVSKVSVV